MAVTHHKRLKFSSPFKTSIFYAMCMVFAHNFKCTQWVVFIYFYYSWHCSNFASYVRFSFLFVEYTLSCFISYDTLVLVTSLHSLSLRSIVDIYPSSGEGVSIFILSLFFYHYKKYWTLFFFFVIFRCSASIWLT